VSAYYIHSDTGAENAHSPSSLSLLWEQTSLVLVNN
jgi:hypothetical protein